MSLERRSGSFTTSRVFSDTSNWYHVVVKSTSSDYTLYINGVQEQTASGTANPYTAGDFNIGSNAPSASSSWGFDGYMAEFHWVDGTALNPDSFGETDSTYGHWKPIEYTGSHGSDGFYLDFSNSSALGDDAAGSNDFTVTNITASDQVKDSPTNNFAALNPLQKDAQGSNHTYSEGNLKVVEAGGGGYWRESFATFEVPKTGKWYMEFYHVSGYAHIGLMSGSHAVSTSDAMQTGHVWYDYDTQQGGTIAYNNSSQTTGGTGANLVYAISVDAGVVKMYKSNVLQHTFSQNLSTAGSHAVMPIVQMYGGATWVANFGQDHTFAGNKSGGANAQDASELGSFYYSPPSEHKALCSQNLDDPTVIPSEHFGTVIYTGDGGSDRTISTNLSAVDFVWLKIRSGSDDHRLANTVTGGNKHLKSNATDVEATGTTIIKSFSGSTFNVGSDGAVNGNSSTYVAWCWKANGSGSSNEDGSINTTATSANTSAGFSISTYTGESGNGTVGHGLSEAPNLVIVKARSNADQWRVGSIQVLDSMDFTDYLRLNDAGGKADEATTWHDTAPTSSVFSVGSDSATNHPGYTYVAYCFHNVEGYSKIGSYKGNSNTDGTFVYCGFRPQWLLIKPSNYGDGWKLFDTVRGAQNGPYNQYPPGDLKPNTSAGENFSTSFNLDFLSNGFKWRASDNSVNGGYNYLFYAIAEQPFKHSNAR